MKRTLTFTAAAAALLLAGSQTEAAPRRNVNDGLTGGGKHYCPVVGGVQTCGPNGGYRAINARNCSRANCKAGGMVDYFERGTARADVPRPATPKTSKAKRK
jgi:hypothetical protein